MLMPEIYGLSFGTKNGVGRRGIKYPARWVVCSSGSVQALRTGIYLSFGVGSHKGVVFSRNGECREICRLFA